MNSIRYCPVCSTPNDTSRCSACHADLDDPLIYPVDLDREQLSSLIGELIDQPLTDEELDPLGAPIPISEIVPGIPLTDEEAAEEDVIELGPEHLVPDDENPLLCGTCGRSRLATDIVCEGCGMWFDE